MSKSQFLKNRKYLLNVAGVLAAIFAWWFVTHFGILSSLFVASPYQVILAIAQTYDALAQNMYISAVRLLEGFFLAAAIGITLGMMSGGIQIFDWILSPPIEILRSIPNLAWVPIAIIWFGIGDPSKLFIISFSAFFPIFTNTYTGVRAVDPQLLRAGLSLGAKKSNSFLRVVLPASLPDIFSGLKVGVQSAIAGLIAIEYINSTNGLGFMMSQATAFFKSGIVIEDMLAIGLIGLLLTVGLSFAQRYLMPYHTTQ